MDIWNLFTRKLPEICINFWKHKVFLTKYWIWTHPPPTPTPGHNATNAKNVSVNFLHTWSTSHQNSNTWKHETFSISVWRLVWSHTNIIKSLKRNSFIWRNIRKQFSKKRYREHTCHPSKYRAVLWQKYFQSVFIIGPTVPSPRGGGVFSSQYRTSTIQTAAYNDMDNEWELISNQLFHWHLHTWVLTVEQLCPPSR